MFSVSIASEADVLGIAPLVMHSKLCLPINQLLYKNWPNEPAQRRQNVGAVERDLKNPSCITLKATDDETGQIVGFLSLARQRPVQLREKPTEAETGPPVESLDYFNNGVLDMVMKAIAAIDEPIQDLEHWEVVFMVVEQMNRRKGVGSALMKTGFDKARAEDIPLIVGSEPAAYGFFKKLGFQDVKYADMDLAPHAPPHTGYGVLRLTKMMWKP